MNIPYTLQNKLDNALALLGVIAQIILVIAFLTALVWVGFSELGYYMVDTLLGAL